MIVKNLRHSRIKTLAELLHDLGDIPPERVRALPAPGTATLDDAIQANRCELIDGCLVERAVGLRESIIAFYLGTVIGTFVRQRNLGIVAGEQGTMEILPWTVRIADVAFVAWAQIARGRVPEEPIPPLAPTLAVEVLSKSNTAAEMKRKRHEYFKAGTKLVWEIDPRSRTATVYQAPTKKKRLTESDVLDGEKVLPGLRIALSDVFAELDRTADGTS